MATFQAPPWWPPPTTTFFLLMITGAAFSPGALILPPFNSPNGRYSRKEITEPLTFKVEMIVSGPVEGNHYSLAHALRAGLARRCLPG